jgi:putative oxidoreductase
MEMLFATSPSWAITVIRVTLGVIFFAHGAQKVFGWFGGYGLKGTTGILRLDWITASGGLRRLFSGAAWRPFTRLAALAIIAMMAGAIAKVHWPHGFFINWELAPGKGHGLEANLAFIAMAVACDWGRWCVVAGCVADGLTRATPRRE